MVDFRRKQTPSYCLIACAIRLDVCVGARRLKTCFSVSWQSCEDSMLTFFEVLSGQSKEDSPSTTRHFATTPKHRGSPSFPGRTPEGKTGMGAEVQGRVGGEGRWVRSGGEVGRDGGGKGQS